MRIDQKQIQALAGFRYALRRFLVFSEEATAAAGVTTQQYQAMLAIKAAPTSAMSIADLAAELLLKPNGAVQLVDRLAALGLVQRDRSTPSLRSVRVSLTDKGDTLLLRLASLHIEQLSKRTKQVADILRQLRQINRADQSE
jgi:DNA-binding MarR family transcriptional regulator